MIGGHFPLNGRSEAQSGEFFLLTALIQAFQGGFTLRRNNLECIDGEVMKQGTISSNSLGSFDPKEDEEEF